MLFVHMYFFQFQEKAIKQDMEKHKMIGKIDTAFKMSPLIILIYNGLYVYNRTYFKH